MSDTPELPEVLHPGAALRTWAATAPEHVYFPGDARPMPNTVDYRFRNGWTQTGDLPCREALLKALPDRSIAKPIGPFPQLAHAFDGPELDFSTFCFRPTLITRGFQCVVQATGHVHLDLRTCGGLCLWLDDAPITRFEPFTRNTPQDSQIILHLSGRPQTLTLRLEELHERDTTNFFLVRHAGGVPLHWGLPQGVSAEQAQATARLLTSLRTSKVYYTAGPVVLIADDPPDRPTSLQVGGLAPFARGGITAPPQTPPIAKVTLSSDRPSAVLPLPPNSPGGCLELRLGDKSVSRSLGCTVKPSHVPLTGALATRKAQAADAMVRAPGFEPSIALLLAQRGENASLVAQILDTALTSIEQRFDCSDFTILPLLRLWATARDSLSPSLQSRLRQAILGYRYWLDEPGNDVMWFWSENHVLCFHTAQLIAGQLFPNDVFPNSGRSGREQQTLATNRLTHWFKAIRADGLCEWNSAAYYPIDLLGLLTLHDMAPPFRGQAAQIMDRICVMAALHTCGGTPAGSQGRCYEKELLAGPTTELGSVMAIALGGDYAPGYDRAAVLFCLSDYAPPPLQAYATPTGTTTLQARYTQGVNHAGKLTLWKSAQAQLSSVADLPAGSKGHQAQVVDVHLSTHSMARLWINHPGEQAPWGSRRPSLLAGNHVTPRVAQQGPVALMIYDLDRPWTDLAYTQVFAAPEAFGPPVVQDQWHVFAETVAVWCSAPLMPVTTGLYQNALWSAKAQRVGWAIALRLPTETPDAFLVRLARARLSFDTTSLALTADGLTPQKLHLSHDAGLFCDGHLTPFAPLSPIPHISLNDGPLTPWTEHNPQPN